MYSFYAMLALAMFILAAMMWRYDKFRPERWYMLILAAVVGAVAAWGIGNINDWLFVHVSSGSMLILSIMAGVGEELTKAMAVLLIALTFRRHFDDPMDGIVYGAFVGLGFAIFESTFYIPETLRGMKQFSHRDLFGQEAIRATLHFLTGAIGAFGIGLARCRVPNWQTMLPSWLAASILIHFLWDYACGLNRVDDLSGVIFQKTAAVGLMIAAMILFRFAVLVCERWSKVLVSSVGPGR